MDKTEFHHRRQTLMQLMPEKSMAILPTSPERIRNRDIHYRYRPDSDFYYLTGFAEPDALAVLIPGREQGEYLLFCRERDPEKETWDGYRAGLEGACEIYDADDAFPITDIDEIIPGLMENCHRLYYPMGCYPDFDNKVVEWLNVLRHRARQGINAPTEIITLDHVLHEMRLIKSDAEIDTMRKASEIAVKAHERIMKMCHAGLYEYQLEAEFLHELMQHGSHSSSYPSIIGGGANSCILHYIDNKCELQEGDLVLIDAGAEYDYYASDITRTFPINGRFTPEQKAIYNIVLQAQLAAIDMIKPDVHWDEIHLAAVHTVVKGLLALGLLAGSVDYNIEEKTYKKFFMHRTGHWIGMDVHDVGDYKIDEEWRILEPNMVMTVEPGIYIPAGTEGVDKKWWNIGVRIEDNVMVTETGHEVLTATLPKTVAEIEALMS